MKSPGSPHSPLAHSIAFTPLGDAPLAQDSVRTLLRPHFCEHNDAVRNETCRSLVQLLCSRLAPGVAEVLANALGDGVEWDDDGDDDTDDDVVEHGRVAAEVQQPAEDGVEECDLEERPDARGASGVPPERFDELASFAEEDLKERRFVAHGITSDSWLMSVVPAGTGSVVGAGWCTGQRSARRPPRRPRLTARTPAAPCTVPATPQARPPTRT